MKGIVRSLAVACALLAAASPVSAQGGTSSTISGMVVDSSGAVLPAADAGVKNDATGVSQNAVSNSQGAFSFPGLNVGTYTVTISLPGFKTFVANNVVVTAGAPAGVKATLELGGVAEQITVSSSSEIIQMQSSTVSTTLNTNQITKLPLTSRSAMDFVNFLPGVSSPGGNRDATINGLPQGVIKHHARRGQHPGQHAQDDRRVLRDREPAPRRDRRGHRYDRAAGGRHRGTGGGPDQVRHALGHEHVQRQRGRVNIEFAAELLNAFNHPNFVPVGDSRRVLGGTFVERIGNDINSYEVTALTGTNTSRVVQFVTRINW